MHFPYNRATLLTSRYLPKINETLCPHTVLYNICVALLVIAKNWKESKDLSVGKQTDVVQPENGMLFSNKKK